MLTLLSNAVRNEQINSNTEAVRNQEKTKHGLQRLVQPSAISWAVRLLSLHLQLQSLTANSDLVQSTTTHTRYGFKI